MAVKRADVDHVVENRDAAVDGREAEDSTFGAIGRVQSQSGRPLRKSRAATIVGPDVTYITPSATTGWIRPRPGPCS